MFCFGEIILETSEVNQGMENPTRKLLLVNIVDGCCATFPIIQTEYNVHGVYYSIQAFYYIYSKQLVNFVLVCVLQYTKPNPSLINP